MKTYLFDGIDNIKIVDPTKILCEDAPNILCMGICLNSKCMYDCIYCYAKNGKSNSDTNEFLKMDEYNTLIAEAHKNGCQTVIITGVSSPSEPLLSEKVIPVVEKIASYNMKTVIYTNLYVLGNEELCKKVHGISCSDMCTFLYEKNVSMMVSCDSNIEGVYNKIVQSNSFSTFMRAINNICDAGFFQSEKIEKDVIYSRVAVSCVISKINVDNLKELRDFVHGFNWQFICKYPSLTGNALKYAEMFFLPSEANNIRKKTSQLYTDKRETLVISSDEGKKYCLVNQLGIAISGTGHVLSCLSGDEIFSKEISVKNTELSKLVIMKKKMFGIKSGECPKKTKMYREV